VIESDDTTAELDKSEGDQSSRSDKQAANEVSNELKDLMNANDFVD